MTKKEMVKLLAVQHGLTQVKTKALVQGTLDAILNALLAHGKIELRNFGVFKVKERKGRKARNPRTGETLEVEPKRIVVFRPGRVMMDEVNDGKIPAPTPLSHGASPHEVDTPDGDFDSCADDEIDDTLEFGGGAGG